VEIPSQQFSRQGRTVTSQTENRRPVQRQRKSVAISSYSALPVGAREEYASGRSQPGGNWTGQSQGEVRIVTGLASSR
jgi:hypothetical protein